MQAVLPDDIKVSFEFDQSPTVTRAMASVVTEGLMGAVLTGLMVLLFLRDWRSVIVVVLNIPFALCGALIAMWLTGQTINLMTLGGLALAIGILVDESTVEVENIHHQMEGTSSVARAVRRGNQQTAIPRLLAMLCVLAVFIPSFFMQGAAQALFVPLVARRRVCDGHLVSPLQHLRSGPLDLAAAAPSPPPGGGESGTGLPCSSGASDAYGRAVGGVVGWRWLVVPAYLAVMLGVIVLVGGRSAWRSSPGSTPGGSSFGIRAPAGTRYEETEKLAIAALEAGQQGRRPRPGGDLDRLCRPDPVELSDQRHPPVDRRARGGDPPRGPEARGATSISSG